MDEMLSARDLRHEEQWQVSANPTLHTRDASTVRAQPGEQTRVPVVRELASNKRPETNTSLAALILADFAPNGAKSGIGRVDLQIANATIPEFEQGKTAEIPNINREAEARKSYANRNRWDQIYAGKCKMLRNVVKGPFWYSSCRDVDVKHAPAQE